MCKSHLTLRHHSPATFALAEIHHYVPATGHTTIGSTAPSRTGRALSIGPRGKACQATFRPAREIKRPRTTTDDWAGETPLASLGEDFFREPVELYHDFARPIIISGRIQIVIPTSIAQQASVRANPSVESMRRTILAVLPFDVTPCSSPWLFLFVRHKACC